MGLLGDILFGKEAKFCPVCGKAVVVKTRRVGFDPSTGESEIAVWRSCPDAFEGWPPPPPWRRSRSDVQDCQP